MTVCDFRASCAEAGALDHQADLKQLRRQMLGYARTKLHDAHLAEDAVQEALIGALRNAAPFAGRAALTTWMFGILRHKINDVVRGGQSRRETTLAWADEDDDGERAGGVAELPGGWQHGDSPMPESALSERQFLLALGGCLGQLPPAQARVFLMSACSGFSSAEICESLGISAGNLHVMLFRARAQLRDCLACKWPRN